MSELPDYGAMALEADLKNIDPETARNVLFYFGDREHGWEAGGFTSSLMSTIARADRVNRSKLSIVFPALVVAMAIAQECPNGLEELRKLALS